MRREDNQVDKKEIINFAMCTVLTVIYNFISDHLQILKKLSTDSTRMKPFFNPICNWDCWEGVKKQVSRQRLLFLTCKDTKNNN